MVSEFRSDGALESGLTIAKSLRFQVQTDRVKALDTLQ